ncbi:MAG: glycoside hydrolase family 3 protein [Chlorobiaceae bacterium]|nr:glycoside hydrolase family 3 protein [Chlorobiaceae bacterium]NTW74269.1 glycoside hydrolase family 3 protein [Chlorobiaceae bacterium]
MILLALAFGRPAQAGERVKPNPNSAQTVFSKKDPWVERTLERMTLSQKVGQMIVASIEGKYRSSTDKEYLLLSRLAEEGKIGGIMFLKGDLFGAGMLANHFQSLSQVPLLVSADMERGLAMRLEGATEFSPAMAVAATGDPALARSMAVMIAREARAVGIQHDYAPTVDLNVNPANPVINIRSFGDSIPLVISMSSAIIDGLQSSGIAATAKHFPGHGDVTVDSHHALPVLEGDRQRLEEYELKPFRAAIAQGVMSVMVGHLAVPKLTGTLEPASLSKTIVTDLLRNELGFSGIIVTDAMNMKALNNGSSAEEIAVKAVQAGNDLVLFPPDPELAHDAVTTAVENGAISEKSVDMSVRRILLLKRWLGLDQRKMTDLTRLQELVGQPDALRIAGSISENAITLVRDRDRFLPFRMPMNGPVLDIILQDKPGENHARTFTEKLGKSYAVVHLRLDPTSRDKVFEEASRMASEAAAVILTTDIQAVSAMGPSKLSEKQIEFIRSLPSKVSQGTPLVFVSFGTPYLLDLFPEIGTALCTYSASERAENSVIRVLNGEIVPTGKLPVSLKGGQP